GAAAARGDRDQCARHDRGPAGQCAAASGHRVLLRGASRPYRPMLTNTGPPVQVGRKLHEIFRGGAAGRTPPGRASAEIPVAWILLTQNWDQEVNKRTRRHHAQDAYSDTARG